MSTKENYPRISELPEEEKEPFRKWLSGQTCPFYPNDKVHDRYYPWDYERWVRQGKGNKQLAADWD